jgi:3',5'-cyclic AMP phosphodiesterase CpdA
MISTTWSNAERQRRLSAIRAAGIPYSLAPGNHDLNFDTGDPQNFDTYFPYTDFSEYSWYGGHYPDNSNTSSYQLFSAMGQDFIVLNWSVRLPCWRMPQTGPTRY